MSLRVAVIPEDATYDASILKPVMSALFKLIGKENAKINVINGNPKIQGKSIQTKQIDEICDKYRNHLIIIARDNDCVPGTQVEQSLEQKCLEKQQAIPKTKITCVVAKEEVEAWLLVNQKDKLQNLSINDIRSDCHLKENIFAPFMKEYGDVRLPDEGRERLMIEGLNIADLMNKCDELGRLKNKLEILLKE